MRWARLNPSPLRRLRRGYSLGACTALLQVAGEARRVPGLHANLLAEDPDELGFWEIVEVLEIVVAELGEELGVYLEPRDLELRAHRGHAHEVDEIKGCGARSADGTNAGWRARASRPMVVQAAQTSSTVAAAAAPSTHSARIHLPLPVLGPAPVPPPVVPGADWGV